MIPKSPNPKTFKLSKLTPNLYLRYNPISSARHPFHGPQGHTFSKNWALWPFGTPAGFAQQQAVGAALSNMRFTFSSLEVFKNWGPLLGVPMIKSSSTMGGHLLWKP